MAAVCENKGDHPMRCDHPFMRDPHGNIRWSVKLTEEERLNMTPFPCGRCLPCRINKARIWQHRIILETKTNPVNVFVTLTYSDEFLPVKDGIPILAKKDLQNYLKRLRRKFKNGSIRYFAVGEYGDNTNRPHYHLAIFGISSLHSAEIENAWNRASKQIGHVHIGEINQQSSRYIAGYCIKKLTSKTDSRLCGRTPEFTLMSKKGGGIGLEAVRRIAEKLNSSPYWNTETIIQAFQVGGKPFPLGGYLTRKLAEFLGTPAEALSKRLEEYQDELFARFADVKGNYYNNLVESSKQERASIEARHKIYKQRRNL